MADWSKIFNNKACECNKEQRKEIREIAKKNNIEIAKYHYMYPNVYLNEFNIYTNEKHKGKIGYTQRNANDIEKLLDFISFAEFKELLLNL